MDVGSETGEPGQVGSQDHDPDRVRAILAAFEQRGVTLKAVCARLNQAGCGVAWRTVYRWAENGRIQRPTDYTALVKLAETEGVAA